VKVIENKNRAANHQGQKGGDCYETCSYKNLGVGKYDPVW
jgi:hypothetical protein